MLVAAVLGPTLLSSPARAGDEMSQDHAGRYYLNHVWPTNDEVRRLIDAHVHGDMFRSRYADVYKGDAQWRSIPVAGGETYAWSAGSTCREHGRSCDLPSATCSTPAPTRPTRPATPRARRDRRSSSAPKARVSRSLTGSRYAACGGYSTDGFCQSEERRVAEPADTCTSTVLSAPGVEPMRFSKSPAETSDRTS